VTTPRKTIELNEPSRPELARELREHLASASNELYLHEMLCRQCGREVSPALERAHRAIRAELRRLESERAE